MYVQCRIQTYSTHIQWLFILYVDIYSYFCWQKYKNHEFTCIFHQTVRKSWICIRLQWDHSERSQIRWQWAWVFRNRETLNLSILLTINIISFWTIFPWWTVVDKNSKLVKIHNTSKIGLQYRNRPTHANNTGTISGSIILSTLKYVSQITDSGHPNKVWITVPTIRKTSFCKILSKWRVLIFVNTYGSVHHGQK